MSAPPKRKDAPKHVRGGNCWEKVGEHWEVRAVYTDGSGDYSTDAFDDRSSAVDTLLSLRAMKIKDLTLRLVHVTSYRVQQ